MKAVFALALAIIVAGCASPPPIQMTPMEIQALQTREYETSKEVAFAAVLSVFQDLGYIIESAELETGFITVSSPSDARLRWWTWSIDTLKTRATAYVEELRPNLTRVRITFVNSRSSSSTYGQHSEEDRVILESGPYQAAFNRIDNEIFVRKSSS